MPQSCDVVVVNYNAGLLLEECVASVLAQGVGRLVLVDNASHDDSLQRVLTRYGADKRLSILRNPSNTGFAAACNLGATQCTQPHILFLNPDTVLQPGALQGLIGALCHSKDLGMAGGLLCNFDGSEQPGGRRVFPTPRRAVVRALNLSGLAWLSPRLFPTFSCTASPCRLDQPTSKPFPAPACWSNAKPWTASAAGTKAISYTAKTWTCACVFAMRAGKSASCPKQKSFTPGAPAAAHARCSSNGINIEA